MGRLEEIEKKIIDAMRSDPPIRTKVGGGRMRPEELPCVRQVYTTEEIAGNMIYWLEKAGIQASIERCEHCGLVHLREVRRNDSGTKRKVR